MEAVSVHSRCQSLSLSEHDGWVGREGHDGEGAVEPGVPDGLLPENLDRDVLWRRQTIKLSIKDLLLELTPEEL
jgi:hypothetical protein